jgi:hypothetical protein
VKLVAKGPIAGKLWALNARVVDQRAWRQLHERHRAALQAADQGHRPLEWGTWSRASETGDEKVPAVVPRVVPPAAGTANAVTADGPAVPGSFDRGVATEVVPHRVPGGTIWDDGQRLSLSVEAPQEAVASLLRLARERYGARLGVDGDEVFRERIAQAAVAFRLDLTFADPQLEARRQQLQRQASRDQPSASHMRSRSEGARSVGSHKQGPTRQRKGRSR